MSFGPYDFEDILKSKDSKDKWEMEDRFPQVFQCDTYLHSLASHPGYPDLSPRQVSAPRPWRLHPQPLAPPSSTSPHVADATDALLSTLGMLVHANCFLLHTQWILCLRIFLAAGAQS